MTNKEGETVRISCQSLDSDMYCLAQIGSDRHGIDLPGWQALDRCKGLGCKGRKCPTQFKVSRAIAKQVKKDHPEISVIG